MEGNGLFNNTHNTFYLWLYRVGHMVKDHTDIEKGRRRSVLFNDTLNTFYLRLYDVGHMIKDHSDRERGNPLPPHGLLFPINRQDCTYHSLCYTSHGALAGRRNSSMGPPHEESIRRPIAPWANALTTELHLAPFVLIVSSAPSHTKLVEWTTCLVK